MRCGLCRVPLYYEGKVLFVLWLWHPKTRGAAYLYQHAVQVAQVSRRPGQLPCAMRCVCALTCCRPGMLRGLPWLGSRRVKGKHNLLSLFMAQKCLMTARTAESGVFSSWLAAALLSLLALHYI